MKKSKISYVFISAASLCILISTVVSEASAQLPSAGSAPSRQAASTVPDSASVSNHNYQIGPGDVLTIEVAGEPDLKRKVKVSEQGKIRLPYIDRDVEIGGLNEHQAGELLRKEFNIILKDPQVTVFIEEYHARMASIAGAVNQPKQVSLTREIRLYDLLSMAGGLNDKAGNVVQLIHTHPSDSLEVIDIRDLVRNPALNRVIRDGDFVNVPEVGIIYVTGNVNKPGSFPIKDTLKLSQAIAMAGGIAQDSKKKEIRLVRSSDPSQVMATEQIVNLAEIERDPGKDVILQPYDVIMVPEATRSKQARTILQAFTGGLASALGWGVIR